MSQWRGAMGSSRSLLTYLSGGNSTLCHPILILIMALAHLYCNGSLLLLPFRLVTGTLSISDVS
jgi:hypothetical protein